MADEIRIKSESESGAKEPVTVSRNENQSVNLNLTHVVTICAAGLLISFFLPWINVLFIKPSGFDFAKEGGGALFLWSIPFFSGFAILAGIINNGQRTISQVAGTVPFLVFGFGLYHEGEQLLQVLESGAYVGLASGLLLIILPCRSK